jgi:predicted DNA-binding transcriptional regulator
MVPYPDLVRALRADKASITSEVRHLLRKGLLSVTLPAGEWVRYVMLTEQGDTYAKTLGMRSMSGAEMRGGGVGVPA